VFLVNSRLGLFSAAPSRSSPLGALTLAGRPFSRSYGASLPSSLTRGLPSTLVCSTCRPVSVCGTGTAALARGFSRQQGSTHLAWLPTPDHHASGCSVRGICRPDHPTRLDEGHPSLSLPPCVTPSLVTRLQWYRNVDRLSIAYGCRPRLRPDSPAADQHRCGTLRHSVGRILTALALLIPAFSLVAAPAGLAAHLLR
jgi:hypothetical protein